MPISLSGSLSLTGSLTVSGSMIYSGSVVSSQPITASAFLTTGTITAQTLVVSTISSSVEYASGSNIFGSLQSNRQTFTGSLYLTGSIASFSNCVGIGTTTPSYDLQINNSSIPRIQLTNSSTGTTTGDGLHIYQSGLSSYIINKENSDLSLGANNGINLFISGSGNVGIGTTTPSQRLEVVGGEIKAGRIDSINEGGQLSFGRALDNNTTWYIDTYGSAGSPQLRFVDVDNSAVRMVITGSNVGIGTSTPAQSLEVNGNIISSVSGKIGFRYSSANGNLYSYLRSATNSSVGPIVLGGGFESAGASNEAIRFVTNDGAGNERCAVSILNSGRVGIANTAPTTQFQIRKNYWQFWDERSHGSNVGLFSIGIPVFGAAIVQIAGSRYSPGADNYIGFSTVYIRTNNVGAIQAFSCDSGTYQPSYYISGNSVNFCSLYAGSGTNYTGISVSVQASGHNNGSEAAVSVSIL